MWEKNEVNLKPSTPQKKTEKKQNKKNIVSEENAFVNTNESLC